MSEDFVATKNIGRLEGIADMLQMGAQVEPVKLATLLRSFITTFKTPQEHPLQPSHTPTAPLLPTILTQNRADGKKTCNMCLVPKPLSDFYKVGGKCKKCLVQYQREQRNQKKALPILSQALPIAISPHQQKMIENREAQEKKIESMVTGCARMDCPRRFIRELGKLYKGKIYCTDACIQKAINEELGQDMATGEEEQTNAGTNTEPVEQATV